MEKKNINIKNIISGAFVLIGICVLCLELWLRFIKSSWSVVTLFYWLIFFYLVLAIIIWRVSSRFFMRNGFLFFAAGAILSSVFPFSPFGETMMRLSLINWLIGVCLATYEYTQKNK